MNRLRVVAALFLAWTLTGVAQTPPALPAEQVFTQLVPWQRVNGSAAQLTISARGAVMALGLGGEAWHWRGPQQWGRLPGQFSRLALAPDNTAWGLDLEGRVLRYQGSFWTAVGGRAIDIAVGADGSVWVVQGGGALARWDERSGEWRVLESSPAARRVAVAPDGQPWIVPLDGGALQRFDGVSWQAVPGLQAHALAIGPMGEVWVADTASRLWRRDVAGARWDRANGEAKAVAVGPMGKPWVVDPQGRILAAGFFDELPDALVRTQSAAALSAAVAQAAMGLGPPGGAGAAGGPQVVGQPGSGAGAPAGRPDEPLTYRRVNGPARALAIGAEGSVFALTPDGSLGRWSNARQAFLSFPGQFLRIAVSPEGRPWGVTPAGDVFRHDGSTWLPVRLAVARDIAIGYDGTVLIVGEQDTVQRYDARKDRFERLPPTATGAPPMGQRVAVDPQGDPWLIDRDGFVQRCRRQLCERLPAQARDIGIGPEGSVLVVDSERVLRRWHERRGEFERVGSISEGVEAVAVGPLGKPWLIGVSSSVWSSAFFPRDEDADAAQSATPAPPTVPVFTFMVNMPFERVPLPPGFVLNTSPRTVLAMDPQGAMRAIDSGMNFWRYDTATQRLVRDGTVPSPAPLINAPMPNEELRAFVVARDGSYWLSSLADVNPPMVLRRSAQGGWTRVPGLNDCAATAGCTAARAASLALGPDGTVYATSEAGRLYRYEPPQQRFVRLALPLPPGGVVSFVAVGADGRLWVATPPPLPGLFERVGPQWLARHDTVTGDPSGCLFLVVPCVSIGTGGAVYALNEPSGRLLRRNAGAGQWEVVNTAPSLSSDGNYVVGVEGRPWVLQLLAPGAGLYRAR